MNITPHRGHPFNDTCCTGAEKSAVSGRAKRIFFVTGEQGCGKSTFLAALIQKFNLQPSGFITKKEDASSECAVYMHPIVNGTAKYRYTTGNKVGICRSSKPVGFAPVFDAFGVMCLKEAEEAVLSSVGNEHSGTGCSGVLQGNSAVPEAAIPAQSRGISNTNILQQSRLPVLVMDELGVMEAEAELFFRVVCALFSDSRYYIIGAVKPRGTRFLPILEQMPEAAVFHLTIQNRTKLYERLERTQSFTAFLEVAGTNQ